MVNPEHVSFVKRLDAPARHHVGALLQKHGNLNGALDSYWMKECHDPVVLLQIYQATQGRSTGNLYRAAIAMVGIFVLNAAPHAIRVALDRLSVFPPQRVAFAVGALINEISGTFSRREILRADAASLGRAILGGLPSRRSPR